MIRYLAASSALMGSATASTQLPPFGKQNNIKCYYENEMPESATSLTTATYIQPAGSTSVKFGTHAQGIPQAMRNVIVDELLNCPSTLKLIQPFLRQGETIMVVNGYVSKTSVTRDWNVKGSKGENLWAYIPIDTKVCDAGTTSLQKEKNTCAASNNVTPNNNALCSATPGSSNSNLSYKSTLTTLTSATIATCSATNRCAAGQGDCYQSDANCAAGLKCSTKPGAQQVIPGLYNYGGASMGTKYFCYDPNYRKLEAITDTKDYSKGPQGCTKSSQCQKGYGDCDNDGDCFGSLECDTRRGKHSLPEFYIEDLTENLQYDHCYDPTWTNTNRMYSYARSFTNKQRKMFSIGEGPCAIDDDCLGTSKCFIRKNSESIPGVEGASDPAISSSNICYDPANWKGVNMPEKKVCSAVQTCGVGQGVCTLDEHCWGELKCFLRTAGQPVPGVEQVEKFFTSTEGVCYDPKWSGVQPPVLRASGACSCANKCNIGEGNCATDTECNVGLTCQQVTNAPGFKVCQKAPAV